MRALFSPLVLIRWLGAAVMLLWLGAPFWPATVDDVYISLTYAREWATTGALQWPTGERVEGYSNFLMVALLTAGLKLGADGAMLAQIVALGAGLGVLGLASVVLPRDRVGTLALFALAAWGPLDYWSMIGLETTLFALLLSAGWALVWREDSRWAPGMVLLALAAITRPEGPVYLLFGLGARLGRGRVFGARDLVGPGAVVAVLLYHVARVSWFGAFWPTSYLVKLAAVPASLYGLRQVAAEILTAAGVLAGALLASRTTRRAGLLAAVPMVVQAGLVVRASGDWMTHGRLLLPGVVASAVAWAALGVPRERTAWGRALGVLILGVSAALWMPTGYGAFRFEPRSLPRWADVQRAFSQGLDTPVQEDVAWVVRNVPEKDSFLAVDAGILGGIPGVRLIDERGLNHRGFAEATAQGEHDAFLRKTVSDPSTRPSFIRLAGWGSDPEPLDPAIASYYTLRDELHYGSGIIRWYATHDRRPDVELISRRFSALWAAYPSQPFLAWQAALARADTGDLTGAGDIVKDARRRFPPQPRFDDFPASVSFPTGPVGLDWVTGRGVGLYWNTEARSRPYAVAEQQDAVLWLDVDAPGPEGAAVTLRWETACGAHEVELAVVEPEEIPLRGVDCGTPGPLRVTARFTNDRNGPEGDRNVYVGIWPTASTRKR